MNDKLTAKPISSIAIETLKAQGLTEVEILKQEYKAAEYKFDQANRNLTKASGGDPDKSKVVGIDSEGGVWFQGRNPTRKIGYYTEKEESNEQV